LITRVSTSVCVLDVQENSNRDTKNRAIDFIFVNFVF
jgi:hypothetical protein